MSVKQKEPKKIFEIAIQVFSRLCVVVSPVILGFLSLLLAYGNYNSDIFVSYLKNPTILLLNILPVFLIMILFYGITGKAYVAFAIDSVLVLGFSCVNYYLLKFRDDPVMFSDIVYIREAAQMDDVYDMTPGKRIIFCVLMAVIVTVILFLFRKVKEILPVRFLCVALCVACVLPLAKIYSDKTVYEQKTQNYECINRWSSTQVYISKGFVYPFLHSISEAFPKKPEGYSQEQAIEILSQFEDGKIPEQKRVNVIAIMLEAFCDVNLLGVENIPQDVYKVWHDLKQESYSGKLVTNIFAGGTIDSERTFLTGYPTLENYRKNVNSYVRLLLDNGYYCEGSHPCYQWFYNRLNVNKYLGFDKYRFSEDYYLNLSGQYVSPDSVVFPEILSFYNQKKNDEKPYFAFHVTYQGHGPYDSENLGWGDVGYSNADISVQSNNIMQNYLGSVKNTQENIKIMLDTLKDDERAVVVLLFGDHKPWLGDGNSVYNELSVNLDVSTEQGFYNYYSTEYVIWANDSAKEITGNDFTGEGRTISPCFLMNELFEQCSWEGNSYMKLASVARDVMPVINNVGFVDADGAYHNGYSDMTQQQESALRDFKYAMAYRSDFCEEK